MAEEKAALDKELMAQKLVQAEREAQASLREQRAAHEEDVQRLQREKVRVAGSGWAGLCSISSVVSGKSFFSLYLCFHLCETGLYFCSGGPGSSWEETLGTPYQTYRFPGPGSGLVLAILIQEGTFICKKCCLHMKDHSRT